MYLTHTQILLMAVQADANLLFTYIDSNPLVDASALATWAAANLPDQPETPGQRISYAVALLQLQGRIIDVSGGWEPEHS